MSIQEQNTTRLSNQNTLHNSPKKAPDSTPQHDAKMRRRLFAARAGFFTGGFTVASWAPIIPFVQTELSLEPAVLGTLLFGLGIGSFFGMPIAGTVSTRFGNRAALAASGVLSCLLLVVLAMIPGFRIECAALLLYGVTLGCLEVSANIYGAQLEKEAGHPLMSGLHAAYSVGEVVSAGATLALVARRAAPLGRGRPDGRARRRSSVGAFGRLPRRGPFGCEERGHGLCARQGTHPDAEPRVHVGLPRRRRHARLVRDLRPPGGRASTSRPQASVTRSS